VGNSLDFLEPSFKTGSLGRLGHNESLEVLGVERLGLSYERSMRSCSAVVAIRCCRASAARHRLGKRFLREAALPDVSARERRPIYAVEEQPLPYLVMELHTGPDITAEVDQTGPLDAKKCYGLENRSTRIICRSQAGLVHRDIKPGNICLRMALSPRSKIHRLRPARAGDDASLTQSGVIAGLRCTMAPEQAKGETLDHRCQPCSAWEACFIRWRAAGHRFALHSAGSPEASDEDTPRSIRDSSGTRNGCVI